MIRALTVHTFSTLIAFFGVALIAVPHALASSPEDVARSRTEAVASVLAQPDSPQRTEQLGRVIDQSLDFGQLAKLSLGRHWEERTDEEREEFLTLLRRLLQANYEDRLAGQRLDRDYTVTFEAGRTREDRAIVPATIRHKERSESVVYRLYRAEGQWRIYDLVIDDISLEEIYREGYVPIIEEDGWEELISLMQERIEELERL
jgi:phospholipid transport system substrate-binding protein